MISYNKKTKVEYFQKNWCWHKKRIQKKKKKKTTTNHFKADWRPFQLVQSILRRAGVNIWKEKITKIFYDTTSRELHKHNEMRWMTSILKAPENNKKSIKSQLYLISKFSITSLSLRTKNAEGEQATHSATQSQHLREGKNKHQWLIRNQTSRLLYQWW